ncbi:MAG: methyl-accepting chemotaxis protein [Clostridium sp.]|jgi:methyl-accepting chemotaxis protein|uniref:methyl-accepting chemotaxis protein n=1 Tax=Clostridium sp. TaxID=1506 RepID=UPI0025BE11CC|nr:methyl-accepting chemotaxis protein [Clostridium sp.]MCH3963118.1 methyl-accepting chemotaxis protein [Clostridium sp.]MCI1716419.1 methyl-accepting chemotaxis protein [Clostridium sp.]MCI1800759.1 methyl-accepting chemotaxis protein [Clostridium sp.]MCI1814586.1 methyl-accepting chemotaxis protein [Clostridium sp.]MCI1871496.1 methyl-accepting chemotaxis protein [Clostridium sp.]
MNKNGDLHADSLKKSFFKSYLIFFALIVFSIIVISAIAFFSSKSALTKLGETALNNKVQMGLAMMESLENQVDAGKISRNDAQELFRTKMLNAKGKDGKTRNLNSKLEMNVQAYMYAIDKNGKEMMHPFKEGENISNIKDGSGNSVVKLIIDEGNNPKNNGIIHFQWKNPGEKSTRAKMDAVAYFQPWGWYVNVGCYESDFYKPVYKILRFIIIVSLVLMAASMFFIMSIMKKKIEPLQNIVQSMEWVSKGNMQVKVDVKNSDEMGYIGNIFNRMTLNIRDILVKIKQITEVLDHKVEAINSSSDIASQNSNNVKEAMDQISSAINNSAKDMQESFNSIKFLSENIDEVRNSSVAMKDEAASATSLNSRIVEVLADLEDKSSQSIASSKDINDKIEKLLGKSNEISGIVNVIENISNEINLLSLNASIESARAGEAGRGFSVVSEQIKKLSNDTSDSVSKIRSLIDDLISTINTSADSVKESGTVAESQIATINETKNTLNKVSSFIQKIPEIIKKNVDKIDDVHKNADVVTSSMDLVVSATEEISASSEEINASTSEVSQNVGHIRNLSDELRDFSNELNSKLSHFKL